MTIRHAGLAFLVIVAVSGASGQAQIIESSRQRPGNTSTLRIAPLAGQDPVQNVVDLLNLRRADALSPQGADLLRVNGRPPSRSLRAAFGGGL